MQLEDPPKATGSGSNNNSKKEEIKDDFDDVMFEMTAPNTKPSNTKGKNPPQTPSALGAHGHGESHQRDSWFREEEAMRKKLEKGAINQLKVRIAQ